MIIDQINHRIPKQVQPSFYETVVVKVPGKRRNRPGTYDHTDYEAQRDVVFGSIEDLKERAVTALLDKGWVPTSVGCLAPPMKALHYDTPEAVQMDLALAPVTEAVPGRSALEQAIAAGDQIPDSILPKS